LSVFIFQALAAFVQKCLEEADKLGYSSIAFPALGTGARSFPADVVASTMFHVVEMHSKKKRSSDLKRTVCNMGKGFRNIKGTFVCVRKFTN